MGYNREGEGDSPSLSFAVVGRRPTGKQVAPPAFLMPSSSLAIIPNLLRFKCLLPQDLAHGRISGVRLLQVALV